MQDGAAKIVAIAWSHNNMKLAVCTADRGKVDRVRKGRKYFVHPLDAIQAMQIEEL